MVTIKRLIFIFFLESLLGFDSLQQNLLIGAY